MIKCKNCGHEFDDTKESEVAMGAVECPECKSVLDQEGNVCEKEGQGFFIQLIKVKSSFYKDS